MNAQTVKQIFAEMGELAGATVDAKWDGKAARAIGVAQWKDALRVALTIQEECSWLPVVNAGANPEGFVTLTWTDEGRLIDVKVNPSLLGPRLTWTARRDGVDGTHSSDKLRALLESIRATFPKPLVIAA